MSSFSAIDLPSRAKTPLTDWPPLPNRDAFFPLVEKHLRIYLEKGFNPRAQIEPYQAHGRYLRFDILPFKDEEGLFFNEAGLPLVKDKAGDLHSNPVTTSEYALHLYSRWLGGETQCEAAFFEALEALLALQAPNGLFPYPYEWYYYLTKQSFQPGWGSAMAQGEVLSVLARAYHHRPEERYQEAGNRALAFMLTHQQEGGVASTLEDFHPSLSRYRFYEEYVCRPFSYTLNGGISALLGLYDWSIITDNREAHQAFIDGCESLKILLPYFDMGGFSAYDLGYMLYPNTPPKLSAHYHKVHIFLLHALHSVVPQYGFGHMADVWEAYPRLYAAHPKTPRLSALKYTLTHRW